MTRDQLHAIIIRSIAALDSVEKSNDPGVEQFHEGFPLFGTGASLDSLDLVSVITDLEEELSDGLGFAISLTDDVALTREVSPFENIGSLLDYCEELIEKSQ